MLVIESAWGTGLERSVRRPWNNARNFSNLKLLHGIEDTILEVVAFIVYLFSLPDTLSGPGGDFHIKRPC